MIDPKELRIGNLLQANGHTLVVNKITAEWVTCTMFHSGLEWCPSPGILDPILLTPQWLERLKFRNVTNDRLWAIEGYETWRSQFEGFVICKINLVQGFDYAYPRQGFGLHMPIKYVHKLQNIYFELTGEELTIKEA